MHQQFAKPSQCSRRMTSRCRGIRLRWNAAAILAGFIFGTGCLQPAVAQQSSPPSEFPAFEDLMKGLSPEAPARGSSGPGIEDRRSTRPSNELPPIDPRGTTDDRRTPSDPNRDSGFPRGSDNRGSDRAFDRRPSQDDYRFGPLERSRLQPLPAERERDVDPIEPEQTAIDPTGFNWAEQTVSVADLKFPKLAGSDLPSSKAFEHGLPLLSLAEESAYMDMLDSITKQRATLLKQTTIDMNNTVRRTATWEKAFYEYAHARELAWNNGYLRTNLQSESKTSLPNPFEKTEDVTDPNASYDLLSDIRRFPNHFVGRPIVIYGRYTASSMLRLGADQVYINSDSEGPDLTPKRQEVELMRGTLSTLAGGMQLATVDTKGLQTPDSGMLGINQWPAGKSSIPVLVKGWVVKNWDQQPLIYCETLRELSPLPHVDLIRKNTVEKRRLQQEETWIYYETLRQLQLTSREVQQQISAEVRQQRITHLMQDINKRTASDVATAEAALKNGKINEAEFRQQKSGLIRRLNSRIANYRELQEHPEKFQTYVDMFQYPEVYHGYPVTLHGHVRHVVSYPGDQLLYGGRMLHELWLFTEDSQHNPAVIVTTSLPPNFPKEADVVDRVTVTGCFFKRYVYGSQDTARIAPLILAGGIDWTPTVDQVQSLVKAGHLSPKSSQAVKAAAQVGKGVGKGMVMLVGFIFVLTLMIMWGRAQREERDRIRLRKRVNEVAPEFETPTLSGYSLPVSDYGSDL